MYIYIYIYNIYIYIYICTYIYNLTTLAWSLYPERLLFSHLYPSFYGSDESPKQPGVELLIFSTSLMKKVLGIATRIFAS